MTARKGDIKPQYYKEQGHTWLHKTIKDHKRSYKATERNTRPYKAKKGNFPNKCDFRQF